MSFLAMIAALVLMQLSGSGDALQRDDWYQRWQAALRGVNGIPVLHLVLLLIPPLALLQLLLDALAPLLFGLLWIVVACVVLIYSFGRGDFHAMQERYRNQCRSGNFEAAYLAARTELGWADPGEEVGDVPAVHAMLQRGFLYEGYQRWFAVLFWFVLLGPAGALGYRLLQIAASDNTNPLAESCLSFLDWVPARLLAAAFALTGDFVHSCDELYAGLVNPGMSAADLLLSVAGAAVGDSLTAPDPADNAAFGDFAAGQNEEFAGLLTRSAITWLVVISLVVVMH